MNKIIAGTQTPAANEAILAALRKVHNIASPASTAPEDLKRQRLGQETLGRLLTPPIGFSWEPFEIEGIPAAWVRPEGGHDRSKMILYCHGGGYTSGTLGYARLLASRMALATGYEVLAFQYRLAPEHPYPEALEDARLVWEHLMSWAGVPERLSWPAIPLVGIWRWNWPWICGMQTVCCPGGWCCFRPGPICGTYSKCSR